MQRNAPLVALIVVLGTLATGCGSVSEGSSAQLKVVATTTQVADLVAAVGGKSVELTQILPPNADPHEYEALPSDAKAVAQADVIFSSGGEVDAWLNDILSNSGSKARQAALIDHVNTLDGVDGEPDPHWWHDPRNGVLALRSIEKELATARPSQASQFKRNAEKYEERLKQLDAAIENCMQRVPSSRRKLVTNHDALSYFAKRYRIDLVGTAIPALSTQAQPSAGATKNLIERIKRERVAAIFPEGSLNNKLEMAIADEAGVKAGRPLWADSLGPKGSSGSTYLGSLRSNALALVDGFLDRKVQCKIPS